MIRTKELRKEKHLLEVKVMAERLLGQPNAETIQGHVPGSLIAKSVSASGTSGRWKVVIQWEPKQ